MPARCRRVGRGAEQREWRIAHRAVSLPRSAGAGRPARRPGCFQRAPAGACPPPARIRHPARPMSRAVSDPRWAGSPGGAHPQGL